VQCQSRCSSLAAADEIATSSSSPRGVGGRHRRLRRLPCVTTCLRVYPVPDFRFFVPVPVLSLPSRLYLYVCRKVKNSQARTGHQARCGCLCFCEKRRRICFLLKTGRLDPSAASLVSGTQKEGNAAKLPIATRSEAVLLGGSVCLVLPDMT